MALRSSAAPLLLASVLLLACGDDESTSGAAGGTGTSTAATTSGPGSTSGSPQGSGGSSGDGGDSSGEGGSGDGGDTGSGASSPAGSGGDTGSGGDSTSGSGGDSGSGGSGGSAPIDDPGPGPTQDCPFTEDEDGFFTLTSSESSYVVRLPVGYDTSNPTPTRLLVSLHGCGDTAYNHATWAAVPYALRDTQDYIAISLGGRDGQCWSGLQDKPKVDAAIAHVRSCFYVHQKKIVLGGYSSGGDLTFVTSMADAATYAGILILHSDLQQNVGPANVDSTLAGAAWKLNIAMRAGVNDGVYPIAKVREDYASMVAAGFPAQLVETDAAHDGSSADWEGLIPLMSTWVAP